MEFGFNLAWLIVALGLSLGWARTAARRTSNRAHTASFFALILLIMLLFPVVSISDDIHQDYNKLTSEEIRYKDDLQHRLNQARQHCEIASLSVILPETELNPPQMNRVFKRIPGARAPQAVMQGFPPTLFDLPPPQVS